MTIEEKFNHLVNWCNTVLISNMVNKNDIYFRDMYPYKPGEQINYAADILNVGDAKIICSTPVISRPLVGQTTWNCYKIENITGGKQIHNMQILRYKLGTEISFEQYLSRYVKK